MLKQLSKILILLLLTSCSKNTMFSKYKSIQSNQWHKDSIVKFTYEAIDTLSNNTVYINLRNNKNYEFNNLYLIASVTFPKSLKDEGQTIITDTLEYEMADAKGNFLGTGFTDIKENKLVYKTNIRFPTKGDYHFKIQHAIRKIGEVKGVDYLKGITDVGIEINKMNTEHF